MTEYHQDKDGGGADRAPSHNDSKGNIVLIGVTGSGKSSSGWLLARLLGYGFIDVDQWIETKSGKSVATIFADQGEQQFREIEQEVIQNLGEVRHHVIAVGGGAVENEDNWRTLSALGTTIWLHSPAQEVARRLLMKPDEIRRRPLLQDLVNVVDRSDRYKGLTERINALIGQRKARYGQARLMLQNSHSTPETTAHLLKELLVTEGIVKH